MRNGEATPSHFEATVGVSVFRHFPNQRRTRSGPDPLTILEWVIFGTDEVKAALSAKRTEINLENTFLG